ncbi:hypothetical protein BESB_062010 [Besnoitia besnoiti]|uniref:Transmembrane protein n=1 Tax=Besnoitia besnoiti TaxID=94643 RepID=A0A2A9MDP0_BESBE|nr:hypothetical protein BESB_062010 [Besnoitia besnoiti]PFH35314.1 hypothetical protein BESB_062010 [Besnoitia besnoiti]
MVNLSILGANPYVQNHHLRVIGVAMTLGSILVSNFFLVYFQATDANVSSEWGIFFVQPVAEWNTWWKPAHEIVCEIAGNSTLVEAYEWKEDFKTTFGNANLNQLCDALYKLMMVALAAGFLMLATAGALGVLVIYSKMQGDPELQSHMYYAHCKSAMGFVTACTLFILLCAAAFMGTFQLTETGSSLSFSLREAGIVTIVMSLMQGLVIFAYQRDRALLSTKFEFEQLDWRAVDDAKEAYRKLMQYDMARLEAAKYGGLQSPQEVARQAMDENLQGHDKYVLTHLNPW